MNILLIEFVDRGIEPDEFEGVWEINYGCLICSKMEDNSKQTIIPLNNIFRMTEYEG